MSAAGLTGRERPSLRALYPWLLAAILLLALALRLIALDKSIWLDEYASIRLASWDSLRQMLSAARNDNAPLYFLLLWAWRHLGGEVALLRLPSLALGLLTVLVAAAWVRRSSALGAPLAALFLAVAPALLRNSQEIRQYALLGLLAALSFYLASRLAADPEPLWPYLGLGLCLSAAVLTHVVGILLAVPACVFAALASPDVRRFRPAGLVLALALPAAAFLGVYAVFLRGAVVAERTAWISPVTPRVVRRVALDMFGFAESDWAGPPGSPLSIAPGRCAALGAAALLAVLACFGRWRAGLPFLAAALAYWLQMALYSLLVRPILLPRTALPGLIPFVGFLSVQWATIRPRWLRVAAVALAIALSAAFAWQWIAAGAGQPFEDWKLAASTVASDWQPGDLVLCYPADTAALVRYYAPDLLDKAVVELPRQIDFPLPAAAPAGQPGSLFLVLRCASTPGGDMSDYRALLSRLRSEVERSGVQFRVVTVGSVADTPRAPDGIRGRLLAGLEEAFGQPISLQDLGSVVLASYRGGQVQ